VNEVIKPNAKRNRIAMNEIFRNLFPISMIASLLACLFIVFGCAQLRPGEDPLVVRAEQTEAAAKASFDLILNIDHSDRGFWRTNAPAFHAFAEWLRQPTVVWITNSLPRASVMIANLNNIKTDYLLARQGSNVLITAISVLQSVSSQAGAWSIIATNTPPR
jgi:hypothetical protein